MKNYTQLTNEEFINKYGAPYEGLDPIKRSSIAYSVIFILRRLGFSATCLLLYNYPLIQLPIIVWLTMFNACFLFNYKPYLEKFIERLDLLNDIVTVLLIDLCYMFTDILDSKKEQYYIGFVFILLMSASILP